MKHARAQEIVFIMKFRPLIYTLCLFFAACLQAADSLQPYSADTVPDSAIELWRDVEFRNDPLETQIIKEWKEDGIVCRYVIFKVGIFKGKAARCAAFYTFPQGMKQGPAFVWAHGGGQRAERKRGTYFAKQGFATIDINWGGREIVAGIEPNTDWGKVDPSQGPRFYPGALRPNVKLNLLPDEHTIDPVVSPRNGNWFLLAYAGRRAVTFLEQQPEVDPQKIGFTGYSMGGNITSMVAIDARIKAVAPMVGGSGFILDDFHGLPNTGRAHQFKNGDLYNRTIDARAYWPHVKCPVLFLSASDDFHAVFDNLYRSTNLIPHDNWRASQLMHYNHALGSEQWILLNLWFDRHLSGLKTKNGIRTDLPKTAAATMVMDADKSIAQFTVKPDRTDQIEQLNIYYSHDPNARARFWSHANQLSQNGVWTAELPVRKNLPLYAFANVTYDLGATASTFQGDASTFSLTSNQCVYLPPVVQADLLRADAKHIPVFEDFVKHGLRDWAATPHGGISTYKFQEPTRKTPTADHAMRILVNVPRNRLDFRFRIGKKKFLAGVKGPQETYFANRNLKIGEQQTVTLRPSDFATREKEPMSDWNEISTFRFDVYDGAARKSLHFTDPANQKLIEKIEWVNTK